MSTISRNISRQMLSKLLVKLLRSSGPKTHGAAECAKRHFKMVIPFVAIHVLIGFTFAVLA